MDDDDRTTLRLAPLWVLSAIAGHQGRWHSVEIESFWDCVDRVAQDADGLAAAVLNDISHDRNAVFGEFRRVDLSIVSGLWKVAAVAARLGESDFGFVMMQLAFRLARARGPFGRQISIDDSQTLSLIAELLEIDRAAAEMVG